jgi:modification methylase
MYRKKYLMEDIPVGEVIQGDCIQVMSELPPNSIDLIFADPPYNLQIQNDLYRPNMTRVEGVSDEWDKFSSFAEYDDFCTQWLEVCRRVLKNTGTIWVIGTYHNIFRIGTIMQNLGFWFLNDVIWIKTNPMPNFMGVRFTNAHETLIWAKNDRESRYTFNHHAMKEFNAGKQMRSDWWLFPHISKAERLKVDGKKAHSTQKPEDLLYRIILSSTNPGDLVLDPFFGSGTTGAVAKKLHRRWIGIEKNPEYVEIAEARIQAIQPEEYDQVIFDVRGARRKAPRVAFPTLLERGLITPGMRLFFKKKRDQVAYIKPDGKLIIGSLEGSIHQLARRMTNGKPCNGWDHWYYENQEGELVSIDFLRQQVRDEMR